MPMGSCGSEASRKPAAGYMKPSLSTTTTRALLAPYANSISTLAVLSVVCLSGPCDLRRADRAAVK
jgi:hypothetical protein